MITIPENVQSLKPYKPGKPSDDLFKENNGLPPVFLSSNENNFGPSPMAIHAIREAADKIHLYPDPTSHELKSALAKKLDVSPERILAANGSDEIIYVMFRAFFNDGEEVLTSENTFVSVMINAKIHNIPFRSVPMKKDYSFDLQALLNAISPQTKMIYLCNPNNPTGQLIPKRDLIAFLEQVPPAIIVVIDEAYFEMAVALESEFPDSTKLGFENVITLRSFSKVYGLGGLRLGYAISSPHLIETLMKVRPVFSPAKLAQAGGVGALADIDYVRRTVDNNKREMKKYISAYAELGVKAIPSYGNFVMLDLGTEESVEELFEHLMKDGVLVRRLASFGIPHGIRISIGKPEENDRCINSLRTFFQTSILQHKNFTD